MAKRGWIGPGPDRREGSLVDDLDRRRETERAFDGQRSREPISVGSPKDQEIIPSLEGIRPGSPAHRDRLVEVANSHGLDQLAEAIAGTPTTRIELEQAQRDLLKAIRESQQETK